MLRWAQLRRLCHLPTVGSVPEDKVELGHAAKRLLEDPVLAFAFDRVKGRLRQTWENTAPNEFEKRQAAYAHIWALEEVKRMLREFVSAAELVRIEAEAAQKAAERRKLTGS